MKNMKMKRLIPHGFYLYLFLILGILLVLPSNQAHAWGYYYGLHGGTAVQGSVTDSDGGLNIPGIQVARFISPGSNNPNVPNVTYAYVKWISGFEMDGSVSPWGNEYLTKAIVFPMAYIEVGTGTGPLTIEAYHISDDSWIGGNLNWVNQPFLKSGVTSTLLATQTISHVGPSGVTPITWDLLSDGSTYLDIWKNQDMTDGAISIMFKISGNDLGLVKMYSGPTSLTLEGNAGPTGVPEPATMILLGLGLAGLAGVRRKIK